MPKESNIKSRIKTTGNNRRIKILVYGKRWKIWWPKFKRGVEL